MISMEMKNNVIKAMEGNQKAISELYYATYPKLRAVAVSVLKNEDDAEDIIQEAYIKAFSSLHQLDDVKKFEPWLCRIVSNKCKDYLKKKKPILFSTLNEEDSEPIEWSIEDESKEYNPEEILVSSDTRRQIMELIDSLPDKQRICFVYYVVEDMKISEIADLLEVSESTVKSRINYAKSKMQTKINDLEKNGVMLRGLTGFALFPFVRYLFSSESVSIPPISAQITANSTANLSQSTTTASETLSNSATIMGKSTKTVAGKAIKHLGIKIVSGIVAAAIAITAIIGIAHPKWLNSIPEIESESSEATTDVVTEITITGSEGSATETTTESTTETETNTQSSITTTKKSTSSNTGTTTKSSTTTSKCTHPATYSDSNSLYIKDKNHKAGFENRGVMFRGCEEEQWIVWECEVCGAYPIVYEVLEAPGHDFGEEEVIRYPNLNEAGYYGCRCQTIACDEIKTTTAIPARNGSYSAIDSRFEIGVSADGSEYYCLYYPENLIIIVRDKRTCGKVPTVSFDETTYCLTVIYETKNGVQKEFHNYLDKEIINKNYKYDITLDDSGIGNAVYSSNFFV